MGRGLPVADAPLIKLTMHGPVIAKGEAGTLAAYRQTFRQQHCVRLPKLVDPSVLAYVLPRLTDQTALYIFAEQHPVAREIRAPSDHPVHNLFHILLHQRPVLQSIGEICGCPGKFSAFTGKYYEQHPTQATYHGQGHHVIDGKRAWHADLKDDRLVGISINLSPQPFAGGQFQMRHKNTKQVFAAIDSQLGDCHLFRIHKLLEHRTTPMEGTVPRCAFTGWFLGEDAKHMRRADLPCVATMAGE